MSTIAKFAEKAPERTAAVFVDGEGREEVAMSYGALEARSRRIAAALRRAGVEPGQGVALLVGNERPFFEIYWAAMRSGLYFTPINWHLTAEEVRYIVGNSDAKVFFASGSFAAVGADVARTLPESLLGISVSGDVEGCRPLEAFLGDVPEDPPLENPLEGAHMLYSSGTTGRPKGVRPPLSWKPAGDSAAAGVVLGLARLFDLREGDRYLSPAPLYHTAPLVFSTLQHRIGATSVQMRRFDPEGALRAIQEQRITTSQWVPTMFKRMLDLPEEVRRRYDLSSLRVAIHAAAPCPVPVKQAMIDWWGPKIVEYYGGTEGGGTLITSEEWLRHPGSVGRHWTGKRIYILDEQGNEITEPGRTGGVYFPAPDNPGARFRYYKDERKTEQSYRGDKFTLGDVGYLDEEGYLYLTDRKSHMIISGGVNIYPQEVENLLMTHPKVSDVAVIGVPNDDLGEEVKAVVVPKDGVEPGAELGEELIALCRRSLAKYKCPRSVDFERELPRQPTGKLYKRLIREKYWTGRDRTI